MPARYVKKDPISHILLRPDMYVGSTRLRQSEEFICSNDQITKQTVNISPAIIRVFVEALSNAIDNVDRSKIAKTPCTAIKVNISKDEISIWNDGDVIPIEQHSEEKCYNHSLIFGQLLTGSNYDDEEERVTSGRNGLGIKLLCIFCAIFTVEGCDPKNGKILKQSWVNNMRETTGPEIKNTKLKKGYTKVSWKLDFTRFNIKKYTKDIINVYTKYIVDAAMLVPCKIYLDDKVLTCNNLSSYAKLYPTISDEILSIKSKNCTVITTPSQGTFEAISFVNGVYTKLGGKHVDEWSEAIFRPMVNKLNKKDKPKINISDIKKFFRLFVVSTVVRPEFDGQEKNKLEVGNIEVNVKPANIANLCKWSVMSEIEDMIKAKEMVSLKKLERKKRGHTKIDKLDDANNAGKKQSDKCVLILCEGDSAGAYVVAGLDEGLCGVSGRDWIGIYPLRGKLLNTRNASAPQITSNPIIDSLIKAVGLEYGVDYTKNENFKKLRYGKIALATDADVDGIHIEGLVLNFIHSLFPTLLERESSFVYSMKTPIARVTLPKKQIIYFYDERRYREYMEKTKQKVKAKYYKGLGTIRPEDVPETFGTKMVQYYPGEDSNTILNKAFHNKQADARKDWLGEYNSDNYVSLDDQTELTKMSITTYVNDELIKFSHADCKRSLPHLMDGLKESQRKIIYSIKKRGLKYSGDSLKVAQLGGYVAEHSNYHHGENSLFEAIIHLAASFVGMNNIPLLYRDGMFGTRLQGGKDAASPRYTFTKMDYLTEFIYRSEDDSLLEYAIDDGDYVEPYFYVPIIPMILVNGCKGIGTGWSCKIPCYNPIDVINSVRSWLDHDGEIFDYDEEQDIEISMLDEIHPWYRGFNGDIEKSGNSRYITYGIVTNAPKNSKRVTELPIGMWTQNFRDKCEDMRVNKDIKDYKQYSTYKDVNFQLFESPGGIDCDIENLKLYSYLYTSNMVMFNTKEQVKKYENPEKIIDEFCQVRYEYYIKRKKHQISSLEKELRKLGNKEKFIREIVNDTLEVKNVSENVLVKELVKRKYDKVDDSYDYLLSMQMRSITAERVKKIKNDYDSKKEILDNLKNINEKDMWLNELNELETEYLKWIKNVEKRNS